MRHRTLRRLIADLDGVLNAGSSPVAPVKYLQIGISCCRSRRKRPPVSFHPAHIPQGKPRREPCRAADSRNAWRRPEQPAVEHDSWQAPRRPDSGSCDEERRSRVHPSAPSRRTHGGADTGPLPRPTRRRAAPVSKYLQAGICVAGSGDDSLSAAQSRGPSPAT
jgi:hypothetical protein